MLFAESDSATLTLAPCAGENCLPSTGIGAVSEQLASRLPAGAVQLNVKVAAVTPAGAGSGPSVTLEGGESIPAKAVVRTVVFA